jgi:hypothetical protein
MIGYASPAGYGLVDFKLYMPEAWFDHEHKELRQSCAVLEDIGF